MGKRRKRCSSRYEKKTNGGDRGGRVGNSSLSDIGSGDKRAAAVVVVGGIF